GREYLAVVLFAFHERGRGFADAPSVFNGHLAWVHAPADVEHGQVRLARGAHARVRLDRRITDGTDFRFLHWRKPTPRIRRRVSILKQRTKTFRTQSRE